MICKAYQKAKVANDAQKNMKKIRIGSENLIRDETDKINVNRALIKSIMANVVVIQIVQLTEEK